MITSLTMLSGSPTLEKASKFKTKSIEPMMLDDNENAFPLPITYDYTSACSWDKHEVTVLNFDYELNALAQIEEKYVREMVMELIREEERCTVIFE